MGAASQTNGHHGSIALPWCSILLSAGAVVAYLVLGAAPEAWVFDRVAIAQGEWWRLVTGHWVHSDLAHAGWDITALLLLGALFEVRLQWRLPLALLIGTVGVDAWLWWGDPALHYYCGLSGILNSLLIVGLLQLWRDWRHPLILLTGMGAAMKILVEINAGQALLTQTTWPSVPTAHAAGFLCGLVLGWGFWMTGNRVHEPKSLNKGNVHYATITQ
jgi:rhomboid family GlyGly-CTERM serine protease